MASRTPTSTSSGVRLFAVDTQAEASRADTVRAALAAVEPSAGEPRIAQRYSKKQTDRARRGIAQARHALEAA